ncbi:MAG TPA: HD domain-containing phosphohydrolase [Candidatus Binatia bacterium]|nr:HD domain-containing phosphohydrolase [Candidatus Binatia bacterium]
MADRILIADDEQTIREIVSSMLSAADYTCRECSSGTDAWQTLTSDGPFQLVLYDLTMKDVDGVTFAESAKQSFPDTLLVVVASVHDISAAIAAIRNGAYDYLLKPFVREQLLDTVRRALENNRFRVENRTYKANLNSLVKARTEQLQAAVGNLERSYDITLEALHDAINVKNRETGGHVRRVTLFTIAIAQAIGLPRERIAMIARGAYLHDIGKMAIPDNILMKPGQLDPDEMAIMQEHAYRGYQIVKKIPFLAEAAEIVYSHHEWFNGKGYPRGLKGDEIPLGARIVSIANTLDSITSDLPYREAQSLEAARAEIQQFSGKQFDPEIIRVFLEMPDKIWEDLRREVSDH